MKTEMCFAVLGTDTIIDLANPETGRTRIYGKTIAEIRAECPEYADAVVTTLEGFMKDKAERQHTPIKWTETTQARFDEMLECLPPALMIGGGFLVGEPQDHDASDGRPRYDAFRQDGAKFYQSSRPLTRQEFKAEIQKAIAA